MQDIIDAGPATATTKKQVGTGNIGFCCPDSLIGRTVYNTPSGEGNVRGGLSGLAQVIDWIKRNRSENLQCPYCGARLSADRLEGYPHPGGWQVPGLDKQWLSISCYSSRCKGREISLNKIGIFDDGTFLNGDGVEVLRP